MLNNTRNIRGQPCPARDYEISRKGTTFFPTLQILPRQFPKIRIGKGTQESGLTQTVEKQMILAAFVLSQRHENKVSLRIAKKHLPV